MRDKLQIVVLKFGQMNLVGIGCKVTPLCSPLDKPLKQWVLMWTDPMVLNWGNVSVLVRIRSYVGVRSRE